MVSSTATPQPLVRAHVIAVMTIRSLVLNGFIHHPRGTPAQVLYETVVEVDERVVLQQDGAQDHAGCTVVKGLTGEGVIVEKVCDVLCCRS